MKNLRKVGTSLFVAYLLFSKATLSQSCENYLIDSRGEVICLDNFHDGSRLPQTSVDWSQSLKFVELRYIVEDGGFYRIVGKVINNSSNPIVGELIDARIISRKLNGSYTTIGTVTLIVTYEGSEWLPGQPGYVRSLELFRHRGNQIQIKDSFYDLTD